MIYKTTNLYFQKDLYKNKYNTEIKFIKNNTGF